MWANLALHEVPHYLAEADNPGVGAQPRLYWGPKDLDYMHLRYQPEIFLHGFAGRPYVLCSVDSPWDSSRAPAGSHIVGVEEFSAPRRRFSAGEWRGYSTGSTIASQIGRFRPVPDLAGHRVLLDNVYDCSANLHSGSGIGRGSSYNCFQDIARDLGLDLAAAAA